MIGRSGYREIGISGDREINLSGDRPVGRSVSRLDILIPKKVELLIRFFEPFWISRVFHFFLRTFGEVEAHPGPLGASDETYTQSKFDISGSNETMQNALASIV